MSKYIYVQVRFVTRHETQPSDWPNIGSSGPPLFFGGVQTSQRKYGLVFGNSPPGDTFDYPEFALGSASSVKPSDYGAVGYYYDELGGDPWTYQKWTIVQVPDDFQIPGGQDVTNLYAQSDFREERVDLSSGLASVFANWKSTYAPVLTTALDYIGDKYGFPEDLSDAIDRVQVVRDALLDIHSDGLDLIRLGIENFNNPNFDAATFDALADEYMRMTQVRLAEALQDTLITTNNPLLEQSLDSELGSYFLAGSVDNQAGSVADVHVEHRLGDAVDTLVEYTQYAPQSNRNDVVISGISWPVNTYVFAGGGNDFVVGSYRNDTVNLGPGNDYVNVGPESDLVFVFDGRFGTHSPGNDYIRGGSGFDIVSVSGSSVGYTADLLAGTATPSGSGNVARLFEIEGLNGSNYSDTLTGNHDANAIRGHGGADYLIGNGGNDTLQGEEGNDLLIGGGGDDILIGYSQFDDVGTDTASFGGLRSSFAILSIGNTRVVVGPDGKDTISSIDTLAFSDVSVPNPIGQGAGSRDFEFTGREGILWQSNAGPVAIWLMDGSTREYGRTLTDEYGQVKNPGSEWKVEGAADFDGDGFSDVLFQNLNGQAAIWLIDYGDWASASTIASNPGPAWSIKGAGDFNGDGKADILWQHDNGQAAVWLMSGTTRIGGDTVGSSPGSAWRIIGSADFNGDFKADILWQNTNGQPAVWLMNGTTRLGGADFANPGLDWTVKGSGDFNRDGMSDILWQHKNGEVSIWFMNGTTRIGSGSISMLPPVGWEIAGTGNFNNDGYADILWQHDSGLGAVWLMNGTTRIGGDTLDLNLGTDWQIANFGAVNLDPSPYDFDGDGRTDLLWQNTSGEASVWLLNGTSRVGGDGIAPNPGPSWNIVGSGDFNGDDRADILWQNANGEAAVWLMDGTTRLGGGAISSNPGSAWHVISAGDFNNDGKADVLWQNDNGSVAIWFMNGASRTADGALSVNPGSAWHVRGSGDFNGDGKSDILWQNDDGTAVVWLMEGLTKLADGIVGANPGPAWHVIGAGDFNGDSKSDILWQHDGGQAAIWLMNGTQLVNGASVGANNGTAWDVIGAGDFNGDMKSDILWQHDNGQAAVWLVNGTTFQSSVLVGVNPGAQWELAWA